MDVEVTLYDVAKYGCAEDYGEVARFRSSIFPRKGERITLMIRGGEMEHFKVVDVRYGVTVFHRCQARMTTAELWVKHCNFKGEEEDDKDRATEATE